MERTYELVKRFGIDIDVYVAKDSDTIIWKLPDNVLNKDFLRLFFMGQIEKVWRDCWYNRGVTNILYKSNSKVMFLQKYT